MAHGRDMTRYLEEISPDVNVQFDVAITQAISTLLSNGNTNWTGKEVREWLEGEGFRIVKGPKVGDGRR